MTTVYAVCVLDPFTKQSDVKTGFFNEDDAINFISNLGQKTERRVVENDRLVYYIKEIEVA